MNRFNFIKRRIRKIARRILRFLKFPLKKKLLILQTFFLLGIMRFIILLCPFKEIAARVSNHTIESSDRLSDDDIMIVRQIEWSIKACSRYTPWKSKCLDQALTAQYLLKKRKIDSTLYLGINKGEDNTLKAHAWLRAGNIIVTGGENCSEFKMIALFSVIN